jgi:hypothetical protein
MAPILSHGQTTSGQCGFNQVASHPADPMKRHRARRERSHPKAMLNTQTSAVALDLLENKIGRNRSSGMAADIRKTLGLPSWRRFRNRKASVLENRHWKSGAILNEISPMRAPSLCPSILRYPSIPRRWGRSAPRPPHPLAPSPRKLACWPILIASRFYIVGLDEHGALNRRSGSIMSLVHLASLCTDSASRFGPRCVAAASEIGLRCARSLPVLGACDRRK